MKKFTLKSLFVALIALVLLVGCEGDQGEPGTNGTNGTDGTNGTNGAGFDEAIKNGNVTVSLTGKRPDGVAFTKALDFKFSGTALCYSQMVKETNPVQESSNLQRYLLFDNITHTGDNYTYLYLTKNAQGFPYFQMSLNTDIATTDFKYFTLYDYYSSDYIYDDGSDSYIPNYTNFSITEYSYTEASGKLSYKFSFIVIDDYNSTGFPLTVTGTVNTTVYQPLNGDQYCGGGGRVASKSGKVVKAKMKDLPH